MIRFVSLLLLSAFFNLQAQDYPQISNQASALANKGDYAGSLSLINKLYQAFPEDINSYVIIPFNLINQGKVDDAGPYLNAGLIMDPSNYSVYVVTAYYFAAKDNVESARSYLLESIKLYPAGLDVELVLAEIRTVGRNVNRTQVFEDLAIWYRQTLSTTSDRYPSLQGFYNAASGSIQDNPRRVLEIAKEHVASFNRLSWFEMGVATYANAAAWLMNMGYLSEALEAAQAGYSQYKEFGARKNSYQAGFAIYELMKCYSALGNDERAVQYLNEVMAISGDFPVHVYDTQALITVSACYDRLRRNDDARKFAHSAYDLATRYQYVYGMTSAANALCAAYTLNRFQGDVEKTVSYGEKAWQLAQQYNFTMLYDAIISNLALGYWKLKTVEGQSKCVLIYRELVRRQKEEKRYLDAALSLNNVGAMFFVAQDYAYAAKLYQESVDLVEGARGTVAVKDRLTLFQSQASSYQFLTYCYAKLKDAEHAFSVMEDSRARVMAERMAQGKKIETATLRDLQRMLRPGEACLMYGLFSAEEISILVVTSTGADVVLHRDPKFILSIKEKYRNNLQQEHQSRSGQNFNESADDASNLTLTDFHKVTQVTRRFFEKPGVGDEILNEYLAGYYRFLIQPVEGRLKGINSLLISPDNVLNFIPFEALISPDGKNLVEKFDVRYMHSAGVLKQLNERQYGAARKPLLALGGAVFQPLRTSPLPLQTIEDLNNLQWNVDQNIASGKSQRTAYATLFGTKAMNPLPGTVAEVKNLSKIVPSAEIYSGQAMTENFLKSISQNGKLGQYKVLHLATHGFVVSQIPELSGVAMSIFENEEGGEDGFLNTNEIASLRLNADLTVLSACQTALGKIYDGEGVAGLTQSLILAGSNAALVSLWPVDDASTMLFMTGLYQQAAAGKSYPAAVADLKRRFIRGEFGPEFRHPNFWAPFVYYGK